MISLITVCCMLLAFIACTFSYIIIEKRKSITAGVADEESATSQSESEDTQHLETLTSDVDSHCEEISKKKLNLPYKDFSIIQWIVLAVAVLLVGIVTFRVQMYSGHWIDVVKIIFTALVLASSGIVDLFTKKIPNIYPVSVLGFRVIMLICEFIWLREKFVMLAVLALVGLIVSFLIMLLFKLMTKGGFGMGDVKLLSTVCSVVGMTTTLYTLTFAMIMCMLCALVLLALRKKKLKDEMPFGPFIFIGYVAAVILGTLG